MYSQTIDKLKIVALNSDLSLNSYTTSESILFVTRYAGSDILVLQMFYNIIKK
jgi:hypothetical protein